MQRLLTLLTLVTVLILLTILIYAARLNASHNLTINSSATQSITAFSVCKLTKGGHRWLKTHLNCCN